jgi:hypothetical protein
MRCGNFCCTDWNLCCKVLYAVYALVFSIYWVPAETRLDAHKINAPKFYAFSRHLYAILPAESSGHVYARLNHLDAPKAPRRAQFEKNDNFFSCGPKQKIAYLV